MSLYEYKHPIINKDLVNGENKKIFENLESWYDVVNDYEFQSRCPIILKNSHRNKHFTFACHLKSCPFKVLLSYSGNIGSIDGNDLHHSHHDVGDIDKKVNVEDDVTAAIAAAVAAVTSHGDNDSESVKGPFTVTKIEPYHNHPLESNLSLSKFVLTKIPKILQNDLKFDSILESLCNEDHNTVAKFRVSQYVEESGILEIIKERYGLVDQDLDKKFLSHIARRITTYKARFVLKKKKHVPYGIGQEHDSIDQHSHDSNSAVVAAVSVLTHHHSNQHTDIKHALEEVDNQPRKRLRSNKVSNAVKMGTRNSLVGEPRPNNTSNITPGTVIETKDELSQHDEMAEQLRLLTSHLKEVEAQENEHHAVEKDEIPDENIQPELRGQ